MSLDAARIVERLRELQRLIRQAIVDSRGAIDLHAVSRDSQADTIYKLDALIEPIVDDYCAHWSGELPMVVIAEGLEPESGKVFPEGFAPESAAVRVILDPVDGTRGIMYDKRPAWSLAGVAPNRGLNTRLSDIAVAVMTELPTSKMNRGDVLWATRGGGARGVRERVDGSDTAVAEVPIAPSRSTRLEHGFAMISSFFPGTKRFAADLMETIAARQLGGFDPKRAGIFEDQYICTGGQLYELIVGHDRFNADLRPVFYRLAGADAGLSAHPYDLCTALIAEEAGVILTDGQGQTLDGPLDCVSDLSWAGFANKALRDAIEPVILEWFARQGCRP